MASRPLIGGIGWLHRCFPVIKKPKIIRLMGMGKMTEDKRFVDKSRFVAAGGNGGSGCVSFFRSKGTSFGGPDGANGGNGGKVVVRATSSLLDLSRDKYTYHGGSGSNGQSREKIGRNGDDIIVYVPVGTVVKMMDHSPEFGEMNSDLQAGQLTKITTIMKDLSDRNVKRSGPKVRKNSKHNPLRRAHRREALVEEEEEDAVEGDEEELDEDFQEEEEEEEAWRPPVKNESKAWDMNESVYDWAERAHGIKVDRPPEDAEQQPKGEYKVIADLDEEGQEVVVALGGNGGRGNLSFSSKKDRAPLDAEKGGQGQRHRIELELKSLADVGLIGFPNAGKSSLLAAVSPARPKIASYPFTTLRPHLGVVPWEFHDSFTIADIPGLIEGAHDNVGLGHTFLRHVERAKVLAYVLDLAGVDGRDPWSDLCVLREELEKYLPGLSRRAMLILANKTDLPQAEEGLKNLKFQLGQMEERDGPNSLTRARLVTISCNARQGLDAAIAAMYESVVDRRNVRYNERTGGALEWP